MKKMNFASVSCEIAVADNFYFSTESICEYGRDTVRYAVAVSYTHLTLPTT